MEGSLLERLGGAWRAARYWVREFFGENDYARYVADWQARHTGGEAGMACTLPAGAEHRMMTEREFFSYRLQIRYGNGVQRC